MRCNVYKNMCFFLASVVFLHIYFIVNYLLFTLGNNVYHPFYPNPTPWRA
jgi:hypothetical protein